MAYKGRLAASTYAALERLQDRGVRIVPVTAAPVGWCDQMARMWPIDGVIAENGGLFFKRNAIDHGVDRMLWDGSTTVSKLRVRLLEVAEHVQQLVPEATLADHQPFRLTSLAFHHRNAAVDQRIVSVLKDVGAGTSVNKPLGPRLVRRIRQTLNVAPSSK